MPTPEVNVRGSEVVDALVVSLMIVMIDECLNLRFQVCWEEVVFQQDPVLQGLMPPLDLALSLRMIRCAPDVAHFLVAQLRWSHIVGQFSSFVEVYSEV